MEGLGVVGRAIFWVAWIGNYCSDAASVCRSLNTHCGAICIAVLPSIAMPYVIRTSGKHFNATCIRSTSSGRVLRVAVWTQEAKVVWSVVSCVARLVVEDER